MKSLYLIMWIMGSLVYSQTPNLTKEANVIASQVDRQCEEYGGGPPTSCKSRLHISALIENHRYEMIDFNTNQDKRTKQELLALGIYKARLVKDEHSKPYRSVRVFELEYPDGATEQFVVIAETLH